MKVVKVTSKGQVTLPHELRSKLNILEGNYLEATEFQNGILLKPVASDSDTIREHCKKYATDEDALNESRRILSKVPFTLSEQIRRVRED